MTLLLRVAWQLRVGTYDAPQTWEYDELARNLVVGRGYTYEFEGTSWMTFGTPLYPALLAVLHVLSGGAQMYLWVGAAQAVMSVALVLVAYAMGARLLDQRVGFLAAIAVALHPALILYAAEIHELTFESLLASLALLAALVGITRRDVPVTVALGVVDGLAALTRSTLAVAGAASLLVLALWPPRRSLLIAVGIAVALAAPWTIRNAVILGSLTSTSPYSCFVFWMGNNPEAGGGTLARDGGGMLDEIPPDLKSRIIGQPELEQGRVMCEVAASYVQADLPRFVAWSATKLWYFWWFSPQSGVKYPAGWIDLYRFVWAFEATLAALGVLFIWRRGDRRALLLIGMDLAAVSVSQSLFYVDGRHRLLLEPTIACLAGAGIVSMANPVLSRLSPHYASATS